MAMQGHIVPQAYFDIYTAAPYPDGSQPQLSTMPEGNIFTCVKTGRIWIVSSEGPNWRPLHLQYQTTSANTGTTVANIQFRNLGAAPNTIAAFDLNGAITLSSLPNAMSLATDANGRLIAGTGGTALYVQASNHTGSAIAKGSAVYISGAAGQLPRITKAQANAYLTTDAFGLTAETIAHGGTGNVIIAGLLTDVDTNAFGDGDVLYVSATTAGALTNTEPTKPNWQMQVGTVAYAHQNHGKIVVHPNLESVKTEYIVDMTAAGETLATLAPLAEGTLLGRLGGNLAGNPQVINTGNGLSMGLSSLDVSLSSLSNALSADVTMTTLNTWYNGPSITLSAGTWMVDSCVTIRKANSTGTNSVAARLSTGSVHYASTEQAWNTRAEAVHSFALSAKITVASNTTIYVQAVSGYSGGAIAAATTYQPSGTTASNINAVRIA